MLRLLQLLAFASCLLLGAAVLSMPAFATPEEEAVENLIGTTEETHDATQEHETPAGHDDATGEHAPEGAADAHGEAHGDEHAKKAGLPQFDPSSFPSQMFWLAVSFAVMYVFFSKQTLPAIAAIQKKRRAHVEHDLMTAQKLRESAEEAKARYERAAAEAQQKSVAIFLKAEEEAKAKINAGIEEFRQRSVMQIRQTEEDIETAKKKAIDDIHSAVAEIAAAAAEKIVGIPANVDVAKSVIKNINKKAA